jgi:hypothetical protein
VAGDLPAPSSPVLLLLSAMTVLMISPDRKKIILLGVLKVNFEALPYNVKIYTTVVSNIAKGTACLAQRTNFAHVKLLKC